MKCVIHWLKWKTSILLVFFNIGIWGRGGEGSEGCSLLSTVMVDFRTKFCHIQGKCISTWWHHLPIWENFRAKLSHLPPPIEMSSLITVLSNVSSHCLLGSHPGTIQIVSFSHFRALSRKSQAAVSSAKLQLYYFDKIPPHNGLTNSHAGRQ